MHFLHVHVLPMRSALPEHAAPGIHMPPRGVCSHHMSPRDACGLVNVCALLSHTALHTTWPYMAHVALTWPHGMRVPLTLFYMAQDFHGWDGLRLLSSGMDNMVKVWSLAEHLPALELSSSWSEPTRNFPTRFVHSPVFSSTQVEIGRGG